MIWILRRFVVAPAMIAPTIGASQKAHSCAAAPSWKNATPVDRAGLTEVLVTGIETRWMTVRVRPMASGAKPLGAGVSVAPRMTTTKSRQAM